jgi:predicted transposase/invertase (TIGR01784 family)
MSTSPHDSLFKAAFGQVDIARSELALVLPPEVLERLDLATLDACPGSFVDEELRHAHADLLFTVRTTSQREALVYVLFEHQSSFDAQMPLRLLRYMVRVWERWLRDHPGTSTLPIVLPVLLHHGATGWQVAPELASMLDADVELLEATRPFQPHFRFVLDDLATLSIEALAARTLHALARLVQLAFWSSRSFERLLAAEPLMRAVASTLTRDERTRALLLQLYQYVYLAAPPEVEQERIRTILLGIAGPEGKEDVVNAGEMLIEQGREQGRAALRSALIEILAARSVPISEMGRARIAACTDVELLAKWHHRAITATKEADVFANDGP